MRSPTAQLLASLAACALLARTPPAAAEVPRGGEYAIKAAFLYNFASYVTWPRDGVKLPGDRFLIGVLGDDPFGALLDRIASTKSVEGRRITVCRFASWQHCTPCHILFVSASEAERLGAVLDRGREWQALLVSDTKGFAQRGVHINFFIENNKVRFEVNPEAAGRAGLKISSKLLRLARIVGAPEGGS